jgi:prepilin-type N-terminal cleavage/methylation domain-containing protein
MSQVRAYTIVEILVAVFILSILSALAFVGYEKYIAKASQAACMGNLKNLGTTFANYMNDHDRRWPPHPKTPDPNSEMSENYWIKLFEVNYQIPANTWQCPILKKNRVASTNGRVLKLHYIPSLFDGTPGRPMELNSGGKKHPWLMEISDAHGNGALMFFPQLGVVSMNQFLRDNGIKSN